MTSEEFQAFHKNVQKSLSTKPSKKKPLPESITAEQYRDEFVDQVEHDLRVRCLKWFRLQYPHLIMYAIPNGSLTNEASGAWYVAEGLYAGMPDLHLVFATDLHKGLYIEMKVKDRKPSDRQIMVHAYLRAIGYAVEIPRTFEEFKLIVEVYLS